MKPKINEMFTNKHNEIAFRDKMRSMAERMVFLARLGVPTEVQTAALNLANALNRWLEE